MGGGFRNYQFGPNLLTHNNDSTTNRKWSLNKYSGISAGFIGWKGGYGTVISAPVGLQLNRRITDNLSAFAGVSVAPSYVNFHQTFLNTEINKSFPNTYFMRRTSQFGLYPRAELGLSYTNDEHTFQISGSIGIERNSYRMPMFPPVNNKGTTNNLPRSN